MNRRLLVAAGFLVGMTLTALGGLVASEPAEYHLRADSLNVDARPNECVQFAHIALVRGSRGDATPTEAVAALAAADIGAGLSAAVAAATDLRTTSVGDGTVLLEEVEDGKRVAAFQVIDLTGSGRDWAVSSYEYSGPCRSH